MMKEKLLPFFFILFLQANSLADANEKLTRHKNNEKREKYFFKVHDKTLSIIDCDEEKGDKKQGRTITSDSAASKLGSSIQFQEIFDGWRSTSPILASTKIHSSTAKTLNTTTISTTIYNTTSYNTTKSNETIHITTSNTRPPSYATNHTTTPLATKKFTTNSTTTPQKSLTTPIIYNKSFNANYTSITHTIRESNKSMLKKNNNDNNNNKNNKKYNNNNKNNVNNKNLYNKNISNKNNNGYKYYYFSKNGLHNIYGSNVNNFENNFNGKKKKIRNGKEIKNWKIIFSNKASKIKTNDDVNLLKNKNKNIKKAQKKLKNNPSNESTVTFNSNFETFSQKNRVLVENLNEMHMKEKHQKSSIPKHYYVNASINAFSTDISKLKATLKSFGGLEWLFGSGKLHDNYGVDEWVNNMRMGEIGGEDQMGKAEMGKDEMERDEVGRDKIGEDEMGEDDKQYESILYHPTTQNTASNNLTNLVNVSKIHKVLDKTPNSNSQLTNQNLSSSNFKDFFPPTHTFFMLFQHDYNNYNTTNNNNNSYYNNNNKIKNKNDNKFNNKNNKNIVSADALVTNGNKFVVENAKLFKKKNTENTENILTESINYNGDRSHYPVLKPGDRRVEVMGGGAVERGSWSTLGASGRRSKAKRDAGTKCQKRLEIESLQNEGLVCVREGGETQLSLISLQVLTLMQVSRQANMAWQDSLLFKYGRQNEAKWFQHKQITGSTNSSENSFKIFIDPPIVAKNLKIISIKNTLLSRKKIFTPKKVKKETVTEVPRENEVCIELYGCPWRDGVVSYIAPHGDFFDTTLKLIDHTYDGWVDKTRNLIFGGLGQLTDGAEGHYNFWLDPDGSGKPGFEWVGWKNKSFYDSSFQRKIDDFNEGSKASYGGGFYDDEKEEDEENEDYDLYEYDESRSNGYMEHSEKNKDKLFKESSFKSSKTSHFRIHKNSDFRKTKRSKKQRNKIELYKTPLENKNGDLHKYMRDGELVRLLFKFDDVRNFSVIRFHCNNMFSKNVRVFKKATISFSNDGRFTSHSTTIEYTNKPDNLVEFSRNVIVKLGRYTENAVGRYIMIDLHFEAEWMMLSEVRFDSEVIAAANRHSLPQPGEPPSLIHKLFSTHPSPSSSSFSSPSSFYPVENNVFSNSTFSASSLDTNNHSNSHRSKSLSLPTNTSTQSFSHLSNNNNHWLYFYKSLTIKKIVAFVSGLAVVFLVVAIATFLYCVIWREKVNDKRSMDDNKKRSNAKINLIKHNNISNLCNNQRKTKSVNMPKNWYSSVADNVQYNNSTTSYRLCRCCVLDSDTTNKTNHTFTSSSNNSSNSSCCKDGFCNNTNSCCKDNFCNNNLLSRSPYLPSNASKHADYFKYNHTPSHLNSVSMATDQTFFTNKNNAKDPKSNLSKSEANKGINKLLTNATLTHMRDYDDRHLSSPYNNTNLQQRDMDGKALNCSNIWRPQNNPAFHQHTLPRKLLLESSLANEPCDMVSTSSTYALPDFLQTAHPICALPPHNNIHDPNHYQLIENNIDDNFVLNDNNVNNRNKRYVMPPFSAFIQPPPTHNTQKGKMPLTSLLVDQNQFKTLKSFEGGRFGKLEFYEVDEKDFRSIFYQNNNNNKNNMDNEIIVNNKNNEEKSNEGGIIDNKHKNGDSEHIDGDDLSNNSWHCVKKMIIKKYEKKKNKTNDPANGCKNKRDEENVDLCVENVQRNTVLVAKIQKNYTEDISLLESIEHFKRAGRHENVWEMLKLISFGEGGGLGVLYGVGSSVDLVEYLERCLCQKDVLSIAPEAEVLSVGDLLALALQITSAMCFFEQNCLLHGDLAARNCYVGDGRRLKVVDMARMISQYNCDYHQVHPLPFLPTPVRWSPAEVITYNEVSTKSDVFSWAVTVWEIFNFCRIKPFHWMSNQQIVEQYMEKGKSNKDVDLKAANLKAGFKVNVTPSDQIKTNKSFQKNYHSPLKSISNELKIPQPTNCPKEVYDLLCECLSPCSSNRPSFSDIHLFMSNYISNDKIRSDIIKVNKSVKTAYDEDLLLSGGGIYNSSSEVALKSIADNKRSSKNTPFLAKTCANSPKILTRITPKKNVI